MDWTLKFRSLGDKPWLLLQGNHPQTVSSRTVFYLPCWWHKAAVCVLLNCNTVVAFIQMHSLPFHEMAL